MNKTDISSFNLDELAEYLADLSEKTGVKIEKYRAKQIYSFLVKGAADFDELSNIPKNVRDVLRENTYLTLPKIETKLVSKIDGTVKYLFRLHDGEFIESVFMRYEHGNTLCISSQVGCRMGCSFCASTLTGLKRNLTPSEMTGQIIAAQKDMNERVSNVVMMGIGEPLDNYENVLKFLRNVNDENGLNIGLRHISLSTCGLCDKIRDLADKGLQITLSVSLHASDAETRKKLMPVAKRFDLDELIASCRYYIEKTGRRISFEYSMIHGENDTPAHAERLRKLLSGMLCHVNLIPLNSVRERSYTKSTREAIEKFKAVLEKGHITATVRRRLGSDINASCGQLRADKQEENNTFAKE